MKAVIVIRGGVLEAVYSNNAELEVVLIDHDDLSSLLGDGEDAEHVAASCLATVY